jgi:hypothetical protein
VHHQPALVRAAMENCHAVFGGGMVVLFASQPEQKFTPATVALAASPPSTPASIPTVLRI